jgi:AraC-like DNA-binding protein
MPGNLIAELLAKAPEVGPNECAWPGLIAWRFDHPQPPQWLSVKSLAICWTAQGRKRLVVDDEDDEYLCVPSTYLLCRRGMRVRAEILDARPEEPYLSFVLHIDPAVVRSMLSDLIDHRGPIPGSMGAPVAPAAAHLSPVDDDLTDAALRFLGALDAEPDRRVLAPLFLREITYRLMRSEQAARILGAATTERESNPVTGVIAYARRHISEPLTVADLARRAGMSPSALTNAFTLATGMGPYQFVKRMRLDRARELLVQDGMNVSEVARQVGYGSPSYFIAEFKRHFGAPPRKYAQEQRVAVAMSIPAAPEQTDPAV